MQGRRGRSVLCLIDHPIRSIKNEPPPDILYSTSTPVSHDACFLLQWHISELFGIHPERLDGEDELVVRVGDHAVIYQSAITVRIY